MLTSRRVFSLFIAVLFVMSGMIGCSEEETTGPETETANRSPNAPTIDTAAGAPDDGETECTISEVLHWECSDPDGDDLTYDVYFGNSDPPPSVSTGQTEESYNPGTLAYSTTYYWQIEAEDPDSETSTSAVWSFTTMDEPTETVTVPGTPSGPASGEVAQSLSYSTTGSTNSLGHSVEYRFDWDDGSFSTWSSSMSESHSWASAGTYNIKVQARCSIHTNIESAWSAGYDVDITDVTETVSTPVTLTGPASGLTTQTLSYNTSGSTSSLGHTVEYRFDWGDGNFSPWVLSGSYNHNWSTAGSYDVRAQARCRDHTAIESAWTDPLTVDITVPTETVNPPNVSASADIADLGTELTFRARWSSSNLGHPIEYQIDFGDGNLTSWMPGDYNGVTTTHTYAAAGTYQARGKARCADHTDVESNWGSTFTVEIVTGEETIRAPFIDRPVSEEDRTIMAGEDMNIVLSGASSNLGHDLEYRFDMGDGYISPWDRDRGIWYSGYTTIGDFEVRGQARCATHTDIESAWSDSVIIHVLFAEQITTPDVSGPATGLIGEEITFTTNGATSEHGHPLEYRLLISTSTAYLGNAQPWTSIDSLTTSYFSQERRYYVRVQARCTIHTHAVSGASNPAHQIHISRP
jgi:hypothetical protein